MSKEILIGSDMSNNVRLNGHPFFKIDESAIKWVLPSAMSDAGRLGIIAQVEQAEVVK